MSKFDGVNVLFWDIETLPMLAFTWGMWKQNIPAGNIVKQVSLICISYKWLGEDETHTLSIGDYQDFDDDAYDPNLEAAIVSNFIPVLNSADFVVAHNGDHFDYRHIKARAIMNDLEPFKVRKVDTLKMAKAAGLFPKGNRLDSLAEVLGIEQKYKTNMQMWLDIAMRSDRDQLDKMERYCEQDVRVLEQVFLRLWPHTEALLPHIGVLQGAGRGDICCDKCGSFDWVKNGTYIKNVLKYQRYRCSECGASFVGRAAIKD